MALASEPHNKYIQLMKEHWYWGGNPPSSQPNSWLTACRCA